MSVLRRATSRRASFAEELSKALVTAKARLERNNPHVTFTFQSGELFHSRRMGMHRAKFAIGQLVRHRVYDFRGVVFDVDPTFSNTEEYWQSIPEHIRPHKDQPFYHLLAENDDSSYVAYVSEQNLLPDPTGAPIGHPQTSLLFDSFDEGQYRLRPRVSH